MTQRRAAAQRGATLRRATQLCAARPGGGRGGARRALWTSHRRLDVAGGRARAARAARAVGRSCWWRRLLFPTVHVAITFEIGKDDFIHLDRLAGGLANH